jgi:hypothetical protein
VFELTGGGTRGSRSAAHAAVDGSRLARRRLQRTKKLLLTPVVWSAVVVGAITGEEAGGRGAHPQGSQAAGGEQAWPAGQRS